VRSSRGFIAAAGFSAPIAQISRPARAARTEQRKSEQVA
jgi:hypothetical protein